MPILLAILALPIVEIALFVTLGAWLGLWVTLAWVLLTGVAGVLILRGLAVTGAIRGRQGFVEGFRGRMAEDPLSPIVHQALIGAAAVLLILPGFCTDAMGLLLLVPPVRGLVIQLLARRMREVTVVRYSDRQEDAPFEPRSFDDRLNQGQATLRIAAVGRAVVSLQSRLAGAEGMGFGRALDQGWQWMTWTGQVETRAVQTADYRAAAV